MTDLLKPNKVRQLLAKVGDHTYEGGVHGTCYECPFASPPLDNLGNVADWDDISNDPTEAYFRCSLPGRDNDAVEWGEYSPCEEFEWVNGVTSAALTQYEKALDALDRIYGVCSTQVFESGYLVPVHWVPAADIREIVREVKEIA